MTDPAFVSLVKLLAGASALHGQSVRVIGYSVLGFEGRALYLSEADYRNAVTKNALWLELRLGPEHAALHERYTLVEGVFDADNHGHLQLYSGSLRDITRLEKWDA